MLTFMNSKITKMTGKDKQNNIFQKLKSNEIYIYIIVNFVWNTQNNSKWTISFKCSGKMFLSIEKFFKR